MSDLAFYNLLNWMQNILKFIFFV